jgi:hypothetical protein
MSWLPSCNRFHAGNLVMSAHHYQKKEWCVQVKAPNETLRFFIPGGTKAQARTQAMILAEMVNNSRNGPVYSKQVKARLKAVLETERQKSDGEA